MQSAIEEAKIISDVISEDANARFYDRMYVHGGFLRHLVPCWMVL